MYVCDEIDYSRPGNITQWHTIFMPEGLAGHEEGRKEGGEKRERQTPIISTCKGKGKYSSGPAWAIHRVPDQPGLCGKETSLNSKIKANQK